MWKRKGIKCLAILELSQLNYHRALSFKPLDLSDGKYNTQTKLISPEVRLPCWRWLRRLSCMRDIAAGRRWANSPESRRQAYDRVPGASNCRIWITNKHLSLPRHPPFVGREAFYNFFWLNAKFRRYFKFNLKYLWILDGESRNMLHLNTLSKKTSTLL